MSKEILPFLPLKLIGLEAEVGTGLLGDGAGDGGGAKERVRVGNRVGVQVALRSLVDATTQVDIEDGSVAIQFVS